MGLIGLLWIVLLVVVVWAVVALLLPRHEPRPAREEPRQILDRRLASGEIDSKTYDELQEKLLSR